jgi:hypothetical protein
MSEIAHKGVHHVAYDDSMEHAEVEATGWVGWIGFAGVMMILSGAFQAIAGIVGIFDQAYFTVVNTSTNLLVIHDVQTWGWFNLIAGSIILLAGISLFSGTGWSRFIAVVLAMFSAIANLVSISLYPIWSVIILAISLMVIYAVLVHGGEMKTKT